MNSDHIYMKRFLRSFKEKFIAKDKLLPGCLDLGPLMSIHNFTEFDNIYTAPMFGFKDAHDYYSKASAKPFLASIKIPTLIVSAKNDPFLGEGCFPYDIANKSSCINLEAPREGGHVGFPTFWQGYWPGKRAMRFWDN